MQQNLVSETEFYFSAVFISPYAVSWQKSNWMRAYTPTYLPLCDVQISHLWHIKLVQAPQNNCWHDNRWGMKWVVTWCIQGWADKAEEHECVFNRDRLLNKHRHTKTGFQSRHVLSMRGWERLCAPGQHMVCDVCSSTMTGRWGGLETWRWMTGLSSDLAGSPRADPLIECSCWGSALNVPRTRQSGLTTFSREGSRFPVNKCCYVMHHSVNITRKNVFFFFCSGSNLETW